MQDLLHPIPNGKGDELQAMDLAVVPLAMISLDTQLAAALNLDAYVRSIWVRLGPLWGCFGSVRGRSGFDSRSFWGRVDVGSIQAELRPISRWLIRGLCAVHLCSVCGSWGRYGVGLGSLRGRLRGRFGTHPQPLSCTGAPACAPRHPGRTARESPPFSERGATLAAPRTAQSAR